MENSFYFIVKNSNSFHQLRFPTSILEFARFDLSHFMEQAVDFNKKQRAARDYSLAESYILRGMLRGLHPYIDANINFTYDKIVLDCIIERTLRTEGISVNTLWNRFISPANEYEKAIFTRLSEYKTNKGVNQWVNLVRLQDYARAKLSAVFGDASGSTIAEGLQLARSRRDYFDLAFSVGAKELGCPTDSLHTVKVFTPGLMPNSVFMVNKISKEILRSVGDTFTSLPSIMHPTAKDEELSDQSAMDAFSVMKRFTAPLPTEFRRIHEHLSALPARVYMPCNFKAALDLEIDMTLEAGILLQHCPRCGRYFVRDAYYTGMYCDIPDEAGISCRSHVNLQKSEETATATAATVPATVDPLEDKCAEIYNLVAQRVGKDLDEREFEEWSTYLANMKRNLKNDYATPEDLDTFLKYSRQMYGELKE